MNVIDVNIFVGSDLWNAFTPHASTYTFGAAISAFAIIIAFIQIVSRKTLKILINQKKQNYALFFASSSIIITFLAEFLERPFYVQILGAASMLVAISTYIYLTFPLNKIRENNLDGFMRVLDGFLPNSYAHVNEDLIKDIIRIYESALNLSIRSQKARTIFTNYFTSKIFLDFFSRSGYVFNKTVEFFLSHPHNDAVRFFFEKLFLKSLANQDSYLNIFINEDIFPNAIDGFDIALLENGDKMSSFISRMNFDIGYRLNEEGQQSLLMIIKKYFRLIGESNKTNGKNGERAYKLSGELTETFFESIVRILESGYRQHSLRHKEEVLDILAGAVGILHHYQWCVNLNKKSEALRKKSGEILYEIYEKILIYYEVDSSDKNFAIDHAIGSLYRGLTHDGEDKVAQDAFIAKLKGKIIGDQDEFSPNIKGWYPAMLLIYFRLFGFSIFSKNSAMKEDQSLHIEILSKLSESFPKLHDGHIQEYYNKKELPKGKEDRLQARGREIIDSFLLDYMTYDRKENSLSYYFQFGKSINGAKIYLDKVKQEKKIEIEEI